MTKYTYVAPCLFGCEGILADELKRMGAQEVIAQNGRVVFTGDQTMVARANICSRIAERILILIGSFKAMSFTELFDGVKALPLEAYIGKQDAFPVNGWSISSALHSIPDCQSIIKKAVVERLKSVYHIGWFEETGPVHMLRFSILKDEVSIMLDTSGEGLHKRGYRKNSVEAPIKETLAAAMCDQARIFPDTVIEDPFCGSGTILIEAALKAKNIAPGLRSSFAAERFGFLDAKIWQQERAAAQDAIRNDIPFRAIGYDIDPAAVKLTLENAKKAGVGKYISAQVAHIADFKMREERSIVITNPPYGERLLDIAQAEKLYKAMGTVFARQPGKKYFIISPHDDFEGFFGRKADKRRKLYNGMIKCMMYMYFKNTDGE